MATVAICLWTICLFFAARIGAIDLPTFHLDGAFQTASGLYRLDDGQFPGRDFFPYLGIGPLLGLFPLFKALGADIAASQVAAQFATYVAGWLCVAFIWHLWLAPASRRQSLAWSGVLYVLPVLLHVLHQVQLPQWFTFAATPGNSLRPIRCFAPYLVFFFYDAACRRWELPRRALWAGVIAGASMLWSNDFAIPTCAMLSLLLVADVLHGGQHRLRALVLYAVAALSTWAALLTLATAGHPLELLRYNFRDVAPDQWWYFAFYSESARVFGAADLGKLVYDESAAPLLSLAALLVALRVTRRRAVVLLTAVCATLLLGGTLASVGGHIGGYFGGANFFAAMLLVVAGCGGAAKLLGRRPAWRWQQAAAGAVVAGAAAGSAWTVHGYHQDRGIAAADADRFYVRELGGYLSRDWLPYIERARGSSAGIVFEEYWGLWSALRRSFPAWPVDSVIHALGRTREAAIATLPRADLVITTRYATSPTWQPWLLSQNYWFYQPLLHGWRPAFQSPTTIVWERTGQTVSGEALACQVVNGPHPGFRLPAAAPGFYEVELGYRYASGGRSLLMLQNNLSYGGDADGFVSLDPRAGSVKMPLYLRSGGPAELQAKAVTKSAHELQLLTCKAARIPGNDRNVLHTFNPGDADSWGACELPTVIGKPNSRCELVNVRPDGQGVLSFGPYVRLPRGKYSFRLEYASNRPAGQAAGRWDVIIAPINGYAGRALSEGEIPGTSGQFQAARGAFTLDSSSPDELLPIEVRVHSGRDGVSVLRRLTIQRTE